ncbi:MAG: MATE family efflux transporter [Gammaproteobacteria bacterium]|nr:MATE family efflux transporter [Gammaproteobacteria bacterium]
MTPIDTTLKDELKQFAIIAIPLSAAYLAEFAMFLTTKMVVGKLGYHSLAAVGIAGDLSFEVLIVLMALLSVVGVLAAQAFGAGKKLELGNSVRQGFYVATGLGIPAMLFIWNLDLALIATHQDPRVIELAREYLAGLSGAVLPVLWFSIFRNFVAVLSQTVSILVISVLAVVLNYVLTLWLVYGGLGLPPLGLFGAGLATTVVSWFMFFALALHVYHKPMFRGYGLFKEKWRLHWPLCREIMWLGLPVAGLTFLEAGLFVATSVLSGVIGAKTLAAYEITAAWIGIPFVIAFGIAEATMIRVAHAIGRNSMPDARRCGFLGMGLVVSITAFMIVVPIAFSKEIILVFITPEDPGYEQVSALATQFLFIGALFMIFDALQAAAARALRGMKDNLVPLWIAGFGYWILGIGGGSVLAFHYQMGGVGLWWGLAIGLAVAACLLSLRFHFFTRPAGLSSAV